MGNDVTPLIGRTLADNVTAEEIQLERKRLLSEFKLRPVSVFDSNKKTSGRKDVIGCEDEDGRRVILRIGERRPEYFFPDGLVSKILRVPRQFHFGGTRIPFEIEEWIEGQKAWELERELARPGQISPMMRDTLIAVFWEFQRVMESLPLEQLFTIEKVRAFAEQAGELLPSKAKSLIEEQETFWNDPYPAKWKFSTDNLILDPQGRVTLIDNVKVGGRYFGYDLGFLIWPRWVEVGSLEGAALEEHLAYLDAFKQSWIVAAPSDVRQPKDLDRAFTLMLFERLVGSLYDVQRQVSHFAQWGMLGDEGAGKRAAHAAFLQRLLSIVMERLR